MNLEFASTEKLNDLKRRLQLERNKKARRAFRRMILKEEYRIDSYNLEVAMKRKHHVKS